MDHKDEAAENRGRFLEVLREFSTAMLVTRRGQAMRGRPLEIAEIRDDGEVLFATSLDSPKISEIVKEPGVCVVLQGGGAYASMSGEARIVNDPATIDRLWSEAWRVWFPEGRESADLCLLAVDPTSGEYWRSEGLKGAAFAFEMARAYIKGETPRADAERNAKVEL